MNCASAIILILLSASSIFLLQQLVMFVSAIRSNRPIRITNKETGRTAWVSRRMDKADRKSISALFDKAMSTPGKSEF